MGFLGLLSAIGNVVGTFMGLLSGSKQESLYRQQQAYQETQTDLAIENLKGNISALTTNVGALKGEKQFAFGDTKTEQNNLFGGEFGKQLHLASGKLTTSIAGSGAKVSSGIGAAQAEAFMTEAELQRQETKTQYTNAIATAQNALDTQKSELAIWERYKYPYGKPEQGPSGTTPTGAVTDWANNIGA